MKIRYKGGKSHYSVDRNRKSYHFNKDNNRVLETHDQNLVNHIFGLDNRQEFEVVEEEIEIPKSVISEDNLEDQRVVLPKKILKQEPLEIKKKPGRPFKKGNGK